MRTFGDIDPESEKIGTVFCTLDQQEANQPRFMHQTGSCLLCHGSSQTKNKPGQPWSGPTNHPYLLSPHRPPNGLVKAWKNLRSQPWLSRAGGDVLDPGLGVARRPEMRSMRMR